MSDYTLEFLVNTHTLPVGGSSIDSPLGIAHPDMNVYQGDSKIQSGISGDTKVQLPKNSDVRITVTDTSGDIFSTSAPVRFLAATWNNGAATVNVMTNDSTKPIDTPQFDENFPQLPELEYKSGQPAWVDDKNSTFNTYMKGSMIGNDVNLKTVSIVRPYVSFSIQQITGTLWYGLEIAAVKSGTFRGYYWFDPYIVVTS